jgi:uncharacterized protein YabN with tetrapyrrole methylase and pyrophosphatase domain
MTAAPDLLRLLDIMARLRDPERGCPWDRAQSFATIAPYTIEEAYEVAEACEQGDMAALKDELGDLLFQVVFHARMAEEAGLFAFNDVARAIADKMLRRHPHVFADAVIADAAAQTVAWEEHKAAERRAKAAADGGAPASALDGVDAALPALTRALKLQAAIEDEVGDLLFAVVNLARRLAIDPEQALRGACRKFDRRFRRVEALLAEAGSAPDSASLDEMEAQWKRAKAEERSGSGDSNG